MCINLLTSINMTQLSKKVHIPRHSDHGSGDLDTQNSPALATTTALRPCNLFNPPLTPLCPASVFHKAHQPPLFRRRQPLPWDVNQHGLMGEVAECRVPAFKGGCEATAIAHGHPTESRRTRGSFSYPPRRPPSPARDIPHPKPRNPLARLPVRAADLNPEG